MIVLLSVGLFVLICGITKTHFIVYRLMVTRSRVLWGKKVHVFNQIAGLLVIILGTLFTLGKI